MKKRVVIAGFGDTGLLVAINLGKDFDIVGISPKPCLVSGQELGMRLTQPKAWKKDYLMPFSRYKQLHGVRTLQGLITAIDPDTSTVSDYWGRRHWRECRGQPSGTMSRKICALFLQ